ncbi:MAG: gliding motility-associated ABC transporter substrate-binding protein GldG [Flavobacteriaceae bacterium]
MIRKVLYIWLPVILLIGIANAISSFVYKRFDLTEDRRYSLSEAAEQTISKNESPIIVDVLLAGDLPVEFEKLRVETKLILEQFAAINGNIKFDFIDPLEDESQAEVTLAQLQRIGLKPASVTIEENGRVSQELVIPWAMVNQGNRTIKVPLLKNKLGASSEERMNNSVQNLEYAFADAFAKLGLTEKKKIAVLKGNGELDDIYLADLLGSLRDYYNIGAITLDSVAANPQSVFDQLKTFDLIMVAKPTEAFTDKEKYVLDQFVVNGGRSLWLIDQVNMEVDSLLNEEGQGLAIPMELNLDDFFFKFGVRINPDLISDLYFTQIVLATGDASDSQYSPVPWYYHPMVFSDDDHPTNKNLEALRFQFASSIDTLGELYKKTILYSSSPLSKTDGTPRLISLDIIGNPPDKDSFQNGSRPLAVLVEGAFSSTYKNRVKPVELIGAKENGGENKMLVISDGDLAKNQLRQGRPLELGYDKWTNNFYGNKEFLINSINFLLDDKGLINIRNKKVVIPILDPEKIKNQKTKWQFINIGAPVILVLILGWIFNLYRRRKYGA